MTRATVAAVIAVLCAATRVGRAEPQSPMMDDAPGAPGENAGVQAAPPAPSPPPIDDPSEPIAGAPATTPASPASPASPSSPTGTHARMVMPTPHPARRMREEVDDDGRLVKSEDTVAGGKHWRIKTAQGAVHVWVPSGYDRATAGTVIYVHGYYVNADKAWSEYGLAKQFRASHQNAMFIVPDAPAGNDEAVNWPALTDLRKAVSRANLKLPDGPTVVMGHSGAFRTVMQWVDHRLVDQIILLDAMYAGESAFDEFIGTGKHAKDHKLIVVAASTAEESKSFAYKYRFAVAREKLPSSVGGFSKRERQAKLLYIRSQYEHMAIVTSGKVIPLLLKVTPLHAL